VDARPEIDRRSFLRFAAAGGGALALGLRPGTARAATTGSATGARFDNIDGVPLYYWRWKDGTAGRRVERRTFASTPAFHDRLVRWARDLRDLSEQFGGLHGMDRIVTAGLFVNKPGQHGLGQAFDLDQVRWANGAVTPYAREHASTDRRVLRRYLAVDAVSRRHFHWVLDGRYNSDHADHLHMDFGGGAILCDKTSRSDTVFVQQVLNSHLHTRLPISGKWDAATQAAFDESRRRLGVVGDPAVSTADWRYWLLRAASCGFADRDFTAPPPPVADPLADLVDGVVAPVRDGLAELLGLLGA
jgi:hypothetical protein